MSETKPRPTGHSLAMEIRSLRRDLDAELDKILTAKMRFYATGTAEDHIHENYFPEGYCSPQMPADFSPAVWADLHVEISCEVDAMLPSYLAPAVHLNNYLDAHALDLEWDEIKYSIEDESPRPSNVLRRISPLVHATSVLLAIKSALDRSVRLLSFYYPGIASHTTWGRYEQGGKASGFMDIVSRNADCDDLMSDLNNAYVRWISAAVAPRDALTHYRDAESRWSFLPEEQVLLQTHYVETMKGPGATFGVGALTTYVDEWYRLADNLLLKLSTKVPKLPKRAR